MRGREHAPIPTTLQSERNALIPGKKLRHDRPNRRRRIIRTSGSDRTHDPEQDWAPERKRDGFTCREFYVDLQTGGGRRVGRPSSDEMGKEHRMSATSAPLLAAERISLRFGGVRALTDVSFVVNPGELFSIIGPNGAGKTSMVNCISGRYRPSEGRILFRGRDISRSETECPRRARDRPHVPEPRVVQSYDRARQHHDRPAPSSEEQLRHRVALLARRRAARGARASAQSRGDRRLPRSAGGAQGRSPARCPTACASASRSRARWRSSRS